MTPRDKTPAMSDPDRLSVRMPGAVSPSDTAIAQYAGRDLQPNRGIPLNLDRIDAVRVNTSAVERRAQTLVTRRTVKKEWQAAWLLRAITCMDLTTLWASGLRLRRCASITRLWRRLAGRSRAAGSTWLRSRPVFPPDFRRSGSASMKFAARWRPGRMKSTWSSHALTFSARDGRRFMMKSRRLRTPADRHT